MLNNVANCAMCIFTHLPKVRNKFETSESRIVSIINKLEKIIFEIKILGTLMCLFIFLFCHKIYEKMVLHILEQTFDLLFMFIANRVKLNELNQLHKNNCLLLF